MLVVTMALFTVAGCQSSPAPTPSSSSVTLPSDGVDRSKTIEDQGEQFTCGEALERPDKSCETDVQNGFNKWGDNLINYANSPFVTQGSWESVGFADMAMAGLAACSFAENDNAFGFTQYMKRFKDGEYGDNEADVSTLYIAATSTLCPEV